MTKTALAAALLLASCTPDAPPVDRVDAGISDAGSQMLNCELNEQTVASGTTVNHYGTWSAYFDAPAGAELVVAKLCDRSPTQPPPSCSAGASCTGMPIEPAMCEVRTSGYEVMPDGRGRILCGYRQWVTDSSGATIGESGSYWRSVTVEVR